jgi:hypothetical protein
LVFRSLFPFPSPPQLIYLPFNPPCHPQHRTRPLRRHQHARPQCADQSHPRPVRSTLQRPANTWLYADSPDQLLGLPAPLWPSHVQPHTVTHKLIRRSARYWGDDKHLSHNNAPKHEFWAIARRIQNAKEQFYKRPPYAEVERFGPMGERMATQPEPDMSAALTDGVPYFKPGCVCSIRAAVDDAVKHALVPYPLHAPLPQTADDLKEYCPCSLSAAVYRWVKGLNTLPPPISAFYDDAPWFVKWPNMGFAPYRDDADLTKDELREAQSLGWIAKKREDGREDGQEG